MSNRKDPRDERMLRLEKEISGFDLNFLKQDEGSKSAKPLSKNQGYGIFLAAKRLNVLPELLMQNFEAYENPKERTIFFLSPSFIRNQKRLIDKYKVSSNLVKEVEKLQIEDKSFKLSVYNEKGYNMCFLHYKPKKKEISFSKGILGDEISIEELEENSDKIDDTSEFFDFFYKKRKGGD